MILLPQHLMAGCGYVYASQVHLGPLPSTALYATRSEHGSLSVLPEFECITNRIDDILVPDEHECRHSGDGVLTSDGLNLINVYLCEGDVGIPFTQLPKLRCNCMTWSLEGVQGICLSVS